jgi:hypothetical protein
VNSRRKGASGELELVHELRAMGFADAARSAQRCGRNGTADLVPESLPGYHIECKRPARIAATAYYEQAKRDAKGSTPLVCMRENNGEWLAMLSLADFVALYRAARESHDADKA